MNFFLSFSIFAEKKEDLGVFWYWINLIVRKERNICVCLIERVREIEGEKLCFVVIVVFV